MMNKYQKGTSRGGLVNQGYSGSWGDRGQGNELQSTLEKGFSKIANVVVNFGDYIDDGLAYVAGLLPGGETAKQSLQTNRNKRQTKPGSYYSSATGQHMIKPYTGTPILPGFPKNFQSINKVLSAVPNKTPKINITPNVRTRVGDIEINNPSMYYRQGSKEMAQDFLETGVVGTDGSFSNPMFSKGGLWYGVPTEESLQGGRVLKVGKLNISKKNEVAPKTHLLVSDAPMVGANQRSGRSPIKVGKESVRPIGDVEKRKWVEQGLGKEAEEYNKLYYQGELTTGPTKVLNGGGSRRIPMVKDGANKDNTTLFEFVPGYGYKRFNTIGFAKFRNE